MSAMRDEIVQFLNAYILEYNPNKGCDDDKGA